jgi:hypothetical protein
MKKFVPAVIAILALYFGLEYFDQAENSTKPAAPVSSTASGARESFTSGAQTQGRGSVTRILPDDNDGSRHQRFIIRLESGRTLLIAHNIDVAPRISPLREGDTVAFNGIYEANDKGGLIHWTHRDPQGRHEPGWLRHKGKTYQ